MTSQLHVALVQAPPVFLNLAASLDKAIGLIEEATLAGARLIVFPETWLTGYPVWLDEAPGSAMWGHAPAESLFRRLFENSPALDGPEIARLAAVASERDVEVILGVHERLGGSLYNAIVFLAPGEPARVHRKLTPTYNERLIWAQGDGSTLQAWPRDYGVVGALVCWEHWMPFTRAAMHAQNEAVHVALWPAVTELHQLASRHYAFEGQCFVLASGCVLTRDDVLAGFDSLPGAAPVGRRLLESIPADKPFLKDGGGAVIAPDTSYVAGPIYGDPATVYAQIDLGRVIAGRMYLDTHGHYARPDVFELRVDTRRRSGVAFEAGPSLP